MRTHPSYVVSAVCPLRQPASISTTDWILQHQIQSPGSQYAVPTAPPSSIGSKGRHSVYHGFQFPREVDKINELVTSLLAFRSPHDCHQLSSRNQDRQLLFFCVLMTHSVYHPCMVYLILAAAESEGRSHGWKRSTEKD